MSGRGASHGPKECLPFAAATRYSVNTSPTVATAGPDLHHNRALHCCFSRGGSLRAPSSHFSSSASKASLGLRGIPLGSIPSLSSIPSMSKVLTRRQQWRRVKHDKTPGSELFRSVDFSRPTLQESQSDTNVSLSKLFDSSMNLFRSVSAPGRASMTVPTRRKKSVSFETSVVRVILIPTRQELMNVLIDDPIWWSTDDFILFKTDALEELRELMSRHSHLDPKMASRLLYQPEYDTEFGGLLDSTQHLSFRCLEHPEDVNPNQHDLESGYCVA